MSGRILIAEAAAGARILLQARLAAQAYEVALAADRAELVRQVRKAAPDVLILPERLGGGDAGALIRAVRALPGAETLPVVVRLAEAGDRGARLAALEAGADALVGPAADAALLAATIRNLTRRSAGAAELAEATSGPGFADPAPGFAPAGRIVLIAPDAATGTAWCRELGPRLRGRIRVLEAATALTDLRREEPPDAILVAENPAAPERALQLVSELRCRAATMHAAILLVQCDTGWGRAVMALDIGIDDLIETGFDAAEVALRLRRALARKAREDRARAALRDGVRLAVTDPLTGLFNRRYAMARLEHIAAEAQRTDAPFAVLAMDLDRFKAINDRYGHPAGDATLIETARRMNGCLRQDDLLARTGGEEFLAVLRGCSLDQAKGAADRIRQAIGERPVALPDGRVVAVTLSIGLVLAGAGDTEPHALLARADRALYTAKSDGRNQVTVGSHAA
ncbi:diguanylate cyclase [Psychromarinibacter sp. C21-152]|uniref:diguanylate cyclase n=1 Tax=Psychromarinibacter sediminicola TaxID=3033385 RepID=A0AAE3NV72_9RHOB|nr:diguanylate cyclase [Psychromarinibacter sediminicola]MDF0602886.1 diguanylate cyclase [Psychromarinibacter sediminicola]